MQEDLEEHKIFFQKFLISHFIKSYISVRDYIDLYKNSHMISGPSFRLKSLNGSDEATSRAISGP